MIYLKVLLILKVVKVIFNLKHLKSIIKISFRQL